MKPLFCPNCRRRIQLPKFLLNGNLKVENGVTIECGHKPCKGKVKFKPEFVEQNG